jgi:hypothetical protein
MAVVWAQNQLRENRTREQIDAYLNQVFSGTACIDGYFKYSISTFQEELYLLQ